MLHGGKELVVRDGLQSFALNHPSSIHLRSQRPDLAQGCAFACSDESKLEFPRATAAHRSAERRRRCSVTPTELGANCSRKASSAIVRSGAILHRAIGDAGATESEGRPIA